jgi:hypothetical protein
VARCLGEAGGAGPCTGLTPAQIVQKMRGQAESHSGSVPGYGFTGDPLRAFAGAYFGYLARVPVTDTTAPTAGALAPADAATAVATDASVSVTFSEPMDKAATQAAFSLKRSGDGTAVPGTFGWSGNTLTFRPSAALAQGTQHQAVVTQGARDLARNALAAERAWTFKTATTATVVPSSTTIESGTLRSGGFSRLGADDNLFFEVNSTTATTRTSSWWARFAGVSRDLRSLRVVYRGRNSVTCAQTVSIWRPTTGSWVQLDSRSVGTTEVQVDRSAAGTLSDFVSASSDVNVRVRCTSGSAGFYASADQLRLITTRP